MLETLLALRSVEVIGRTDGGRRPPIARGLYTDPTDNLFRQSV